MNEEINYVGNNSIPPVDQPKVSKNPKVKDFSNVDLNEKPKDFSDDSIVDIQEFILGKSVKRTVKIDKSRSVVVHVTPLSTDELSRIQARQLSVSEANKFMVQHHVFDKDDIPFSHDVIDNLGYGVIAKLAEEVKLVSGEDIEANERIFTKAWAEYLRTS